jgi:hypothetical protein
MAKDNLKKQGNVNKIMQYTLRLPYPLYKAVKYKLVKEDKKLQPVLIEMLEKYVKS